MEAIETTYEKKIDALLSKMFGESPSELKMVTKLSLMNNVLTDEMKRTLEELRDKAIKEAQMIHDEMTMTLDANGNTIPVEESPRQHDIKVIYHDN